MAIKKPSKTYVLDTNILLRFLLNDHPTYSKKAYTIFQNIAQNKAVGKINHVTIAETYFVLLKVYEINTKNISENLMLILQLNNIHTPKKLFVLQVLENLSYYKLSFVDLYNLFYALSESAQLQTFDKKLLRLYNQLTKK